LNYEVPLCDVKVGVVTPGVSRIIGPITYGACCRTVGEGGGGRSIQDVVCAVSQVELWCPVNIVFISSDMCLQAKGKHLQYLFQYGE